MYHEIVKLDVKEGDSVTCLANYWLRSTRIAMCQLSPEELRSKQC